MPFQNCWNEATCIGKHAGKKGHPQQAVTDHRRRNTSRGTRQACGFSPSYVVATKLGNESGKLSPLIKREPQGINAVGDEEWVEIEAAIDNAQQTTPRDMAPAPLGMFE